MGKNIILIGFMGTGKSSVGHHLAQKLDMQFIDMDKEIEQLLDMSILRIFKVYGEKRFRSEEKLLAQKLCKLHNRVISTGGGVLLDGENYDTLKQTGILIRLNADPQEIWERIQRKKNNRPMLKKMTNLREMICFMEEREKYYASADIAVETSGKDLDQVVHEIIAAMGRTGYDDQVEEAPEIAGHFGNREL